jgi:membrane protease subunit HflK
VTRERLYLDMMQSVVGSSTKIMMDQKAGGSLIYLPLDKLMQLGSPAAAPAAPSAAPTVVEAAPARPQASAPAPEPSAAADPGRSRDALRARERGGDAR